GQRCQTRPYAQEPGEGQTDRAEHLDHCRETQEPTRERYRHLLHHLLDRQNQLHATDKQKEEREQRLKGPQCNVHDRSPWRWLSPLTMRLRSRVSVPKESGKQGKHASKFLCNFIHLKHGLHDTV